MVLESLQRALVQLMDKSNVYQDSEEHYTNYHTHIHAFEDQGQEQAELDIKDKEEQPYDKELTLRGHLTPSFSVETALESRHNLR